LVDDVVLGLAVEVLGSSAGVGGPCHILVDDVVLGLAVEVLGSSAGVGGPCHILVDDVVLGLAVEVLGSSAGGLEEMKAALSRSECSGSSSDCTRDIVCRSTCAAGRGRPCAACFIVVDA
jgi:hypothetical protein